MSDFHSPHHEFYKAFLAFQTEVENAVKDATNPHFKNAYATLEEVLATVKPVLTKHGLVLFQMPGMDGDKVTLTTQILHAESGAGVTFTSACPIGSRPDAQSFGSAVTYLRRYSLTSVCGITQADDDGNAAAQSMKGAQSPASKNGREVVLAPPSAAPSRPSGPVQRPNQSGPDLVQIGTTNYQKILKWYVDQGMDDEQARARVTETKVAIDATVNGMGLKGEAKQKAIISEQERILADLALLKGEDDA